MKIHILFTFPGCINLIKLIIFKIIDVSIIANIENIENTKIIGYTTRKPIEMGYTRVNRN